MDFARKQLEKYGWTEGKGLGKNEDGISTAIKPKLKFDNSGVGHAIGEQFSNNWWEKLFNSAAENFDVRVGKTDEVVMVVKDKDSFEITTKNYSVKELKNNKNLEYGSFLKTAKLTKNGVENYNIQPLTTSNPLKTFHGLTDDELFSACGGRTAHKGARHGLKLGGKLSRIEKQEKMLLKKMKKVSLSDDVTKVEKKLKKLKKQGEESLERYMCLSDQSTSPLKMKNKKRKTVSFNETVTKIYTVDLDTSFDSEVSSVKDENSNEPLCVENNMGCLDEGIEQDLENNNNEQEDNHRAFEEARLNFSDLSKAERKKLKKKRKLETKTNTCTGRFLQKLEDEEMEETVEEDKDLNLKKRKYLDEVEYREPKRSQSETEAPERMKNKKNKKKRKKQKKLDEKQMNSITKSLDSFCRISDCE